MLRSFHFALTIFLGAFLSFQIQPLAAKSLLPHFGGSATVWTVSMLFFQTVLVAGYAYAHLLTSRFVPHVQALLHTLLLSGSWAVLNVLPPDTWRPDVARDPTAALLQVLLQTIAVPYFLLAATAPLMQRWFALLEPGKSPYKLYAVSNAGSLLGLLTYPLFIEPRWSLDGQAAGWSAAFAVFGGLTALHAWRLVRLRNAVVPQTVVAADAPAIEDVSPTLRDIALWIALSCVPSVVLLAVTAHLAEQVAQIPLFWIIPLALYLLTFILCFQPRHRPRPRLWFLLFLSAMTLLAAPPHLLGNVIVAKGLCLAAVLFGGGMLCHGELTSMQPSARHLTLYYLTISVGGALGGLFVGWLAPLIFDDYHEYALGLALSAAIGVGRILYRSAGATPRPAAACGAAAGTALMLWLNPDFNSRLAAAWRTFVPAAASRPTLDAATVAVLIVAAAAVVARLLPAVRPPQRFRMSWIAAFAVVVVLFVFLVNVGRESAGLRHSAAIVPSFLLLPMLLIATIIVAPRFKTWRGARSSSQPPVGKLTDGRVVGILVDCSRDALPMAAATCLAYKIWLFESAGGAIGFTFFGVALAAWMLWPAGGRSRAPAVSADRLRLLLLVFIGGYAIASSLGGPSSSAEPACVAASALLVLTTLALANRRNTASNDVMNRELLLRRGRGAAVGTIAGAAIALTAPEAAIGLVLTAIVFGLGEGLAVSANTGGETIGHERRWAPIVVIILALGVTAGLHSPRGESKEDEVVRLRNFYGVLTVVDRKSDVPTRVLEHGPIIHGMQVLDGAPPEPTLYFGRKTGVGQLLETVGAGRSLRCGNIGLGVGALAAYGRKGDVLRYYEIDRDVELLARKHFDFLASSPADVSVVIGDGRLAMQYDAGEPFDVIVLDAFSGDAIPCHLLTEEACRLYLDRLVDDGFLAVHVSNRHVDLAPVIAGLARRFNLRSRFVDYGGGPHDLPSSWAILSRRDIPESIQSPLPPPVWRRTDALLWTDRSYSILPILRRPAFLDRWLGHFRGAAVAHK